MNNATFLDCTLRDGGYYNNWNFKKELINSYLEAISQTNIEYVELGFRTIDSSAVKGPTGHTNDSFINSLKIPKNLKIGVMVNGTDFLKTNLSQEKSCKKIFPKVANKKIKFVRLACHLDEPFKIKKVIRWLKKNNYIVTINLMQISEIKEPQVKKLCKLFKQLNVNIIYLADSLGSLKPKNIFQITKLFKKFWKGELGIHAHNNMNLALPNSIEANNNGIKWIDCTVTGMGRGPGNVKTEDLFQYFTKKTGKIIKINLLNKLIKKYFLPLKKKYKWGPNKYYLISGKNKIHPTYIQEILADKRYKKLNYLKIINNLKKINTRKYNPYKLSESVDFFSGKPKGSWNPIRLLKNKNVLIIGPGESVEKYKSFLKKFIIKNNTFIIYLNTSKDISPSLSKIRVACMPHRIMSDAQFHKNSKDNLVIPSSMMSRQIYNLIKSKNKKILDYGLSIRKKNSIVIKNNYCVLPRSLTVGYSISVAISGKAKQIFLAGFDGYKVDDPYSDETNHFFNIIKKKYGSNLLISLTPTKYDIIKIN
tara:strand:- start:655 stop:2259 length:1605 start_codon:yes stop_codon:yes gene_type:complete